MQRFQAAHHQHGVERRHDGAGHVLDAHHADFTDGFGPATDGAGDEIPVAAKVFGGRMKHEICTERDRTRQHGRGVRIIDDNQRAGCVGDV